MSESEKDLQTFNKLVVDIATLLVVNRVKPATAALASKNYRLELDYSGAPDNKALISIYKKSSGFASGEIKPGLIFMGGAKYTAEDQRIANTGHFTLAEMSVALQELYTREALMAVPAKKIYTLLEPLIKVDDKSVFIEYGKDRLISVMNTGERIELYISKRVNEEIEYEYMVGFKKHDPNTAIRAKWGPIEKFPEILATCLDLVEDRKFNLVRRLKKNGRAIKSNRRK